jgi:hypothetical protein
MTDLDRMSAIVQVGDDGLNAPSPQAPTTEWTVAEPMAPEPPFLDPIVGPHAPPEDRTAPERYPGGQPVPPDTASVSGRRGKAPFSTAPWDAVDVFQRAATDFTTRVMRLSDVDGPDMIVGRMRGRRSVTLSVPTSYPNVTTVVGVAFASTEGDLQNVGLPNVLNPGDSWTIETESPVWVAVIPGQTDGLVQCVVEYSPLGGELGGQ